MRAIVLRLALLTAVWATGCRNVSKTDTPDGGMTSTASPTDLATGAPDTDSDTDGDADTDTDVHTDTGSNGDTDSNTDTDLAIDTANAPCELLSQDACAGRSDCTHFMGQPIDPVRKCTGNTATAGCTSDFGCDTSVTIAVDKAGQCWHLPCANPPSSLIDDWASPEEMAATCGVTFSDDLPYCGDLTDCTGQELETAFGCMTCDLAHESASEAIDTALIEISTCDVDEDCAITSMDTKCYGACPTAVAAASEAEFTATLGQISEDYCGDPMHDTLCGYGGPRCAAATPRCSAGQCVASYE